MRVAWISTWTRVCGIADYSHALFPAVRLALARMGHEAELFSIDQYPTTAQMVTALAAYQPKVIHFQHEYGIFGGKNPPGYRFPKLVSALRRKIPGVRLLATAHTVLEPDYQFPTEGRGIQKPLRKLANLLVLKSLRRTWGPGTWGRLDGVIVHSSRQKAAVMSAAPKTAEVIPHFVFRTQGIQGTVSRNSPSLPPQLSKISRDAPVVLVFGFFTPEKGQDIAIEAFALNKSTSKSILVLAGGVRRKEDQAYYDRCTRRIQELGLSERVVVTGFVESKWMDALYARATLVVVPFRETSGSGSLAQAFARGAAVLASDIALNLEVAEREPGALAFFKSEDAQDLATSMKNLLEADTALASLRQASRRYAELYSPENTAESHARFYEALLSL